MSFYEIKIISIIVISEILIYVLYLMIVMGLGFVN